MNILLICFYGILILTLTLTASRIGTKKEKTFLSRILLVYLILNLTLNLSSLAYILLGYDYVTNIYTPQYIFNFWVADLTSICALVFCQVLHKTEFHFNQAKTRNWLIIFVAAIMFLGIEIIAFFISEIILVLILLQALMSLIMVRILRKIYNVLEEPTSKKQMNLFILGFIFIHLFSLIPLIFGISNVNPEIVQYIEIIIILLSAAGFLLIERTFWYTKK